MWLMVFDFLFVAAATVLQVLVSMPLCLFTYLTLEPKRQRMRRGLVDG
jgi:hypothetical protein